MVSRRVYARRLQAEDRTDPLLAGTRQAATRQRAAVDTARSARLSRELAHQMPGAIARQLTPLLHSARLSHQLGDALAARVIRRDVPPTLSGRPITQTGPLAHEEWEQEREATGSTPAGTGTETAEGAEPESTPPDETFVAERAQLWAEEVAAEIRERLEAQTTAVASEAPGTSGAGAPGDPAWLDEVVEHLTGVAYQRAHTWYGGQRAWRDAYQSGGNYPLVAVCDQLGELIQFVRGLSGYGSGLTAHMEHYLGRGSLHGPPVEAQPGVTLFHVVSAGAAHAMDIDPGKRVPRQPGWSESARVSARRAEQAALGRAWSSGAVTAARQDAARAAAVRTADAQLDAVYETRRSIQHETTIIRTSATPRGGTLVQLFDFERGVAQEGVNWRGLNTYNNASEYFWGYRGEQAIQSLAHPVGTGTITISYGGDTLQEVPLNPEGEGALLPLGRYLQVLSGLPYTDILELQLSLSIEGHPTTEMRVGGAGAAPSMRDMTPPH